MQSDLQPTVSAKSSAAGSSIIDRLFVAGAHYGFSKSRRHPTAAPFLFTSKQGTDIFDLEKTSGLLADAVAYLTEMGKSGKRAMFVGTKDEIKEIVKSRALSLEAPFVTNRWIGGTLTNFSEIQKRISRFLTLTAQRESGELDRTYTKKERVMLWRELEKLDSNFGGIKDVDRLPGVLVVVDPRHEALAVKEAQDMNIPVVALMSSDCNADLVTKPVFVNDAHAASVTLALDELVEGYRAGRISYTPPAPVERNIARRPKPSERRTA